MIGCDDAYSTLIQYPLRTDPLTLNDKLGDERLDPDRPGLMPLLTAKDVLNPLNPVYPKRDEVFKLQTLRDPTLIHPKDRLEMKSVLEDFFGTPRYPKVKDAPSVLELDEKMLAKGSSLYRVHCLHCHGVSGDGRGVTARWINPHPRDFRQNLFKFQSVDQTGGGPPMPPRRDDLRRTLLVGIEGTAMPAFNLLPKNDIEALISYVIHLSIRGRVEYDTMKNAFEYDSKTNTILKFDDSDGELADTMTGLFNAIVKNWEKAQTKPIQPKPYPFDENNLEEMKASVQRGYKLFNGIEDKKDAPEAKAVNCVSCHKNFGRESLYRWDAWGTLVKPNNLTNGIYRGGRRPNDLYYRIHSGINGSGMVPFGDLEKKNERILWDLVNFVKVLPYPAMREKLGIVIE